jgi:hypothetical protein
MHEEELKLRIAAELDETQFIDLCGLTFPELIDIVFETLSEEQKEELARELRE